MLGQDRVPSSQITPPELYFSRRNFLRVGAAAASLAATAAAYRGLNQTEPIGIETPLLPNLLVAKATRENRDRGIFIDDPLTSGERVANYNNFYEFTTGKELVAPSSAKFVARPWTVAVDGMVHKPKVFDLDEVIGLGQLEERVYRMRCVEGWSMVIPWAGLPLARLLSQAQPMSGASYVAFQTLFDPARLPGQRRKALPWPYVEGLRLDEAMHPLTLLAIGLYGRELPAQNGAPLRLVVPWKYGFKGIKSIVKITLLANRPPTTWNLTAPSAYGFYANVNPDVPHPRWSQATEQRIGETGRRPTLLFNGYAEQVGHLYTGMNLRVNF
jgi:methionine sulfoxide reductase catalytic subunit